MEKWSWCSRCCILFISYSCWSNTKIFSCWVMKLHLFTLNISFILITLISTYKCLIFLGVIPHSKIACLSQRTTPTFFIIKIAISGTSTCPTTLLIVIFLRLFSCLSLLSSNEFNYTIDNIQFPYKNEMHDKNIY